MRLDLPQEINKKQWLDRLGVSGDADENLLTGLELAQQKLLDAAVPQGVYRVLGLTVMDLQGQAIKRHLAECNSMVIMAITLGAGIDRLIRQSQIRDMAEAVLLDSGASILAEQMADQLEEQIRSEIGEFMTSRYSPGYGDFPIEMQSEFVRAIDGPRAMGLSVNESHILIPRKSITAVAGLADHPVTGHLASCDQCLIREKCDLKKEGKQCWI